MATKAQIIKRFELYIDDTTELSTQEESDLFDKIYNEVCSDRPWQFLLTEYTGVTSSSVPYIALPDDFGFLSANNNYTDQSYPAERPVVFVGTNFDPYKVVSFSDRRQYRNNNNVAYIDIGNSQLVFTKQPTSSVTVEYDYFKTPTALATGESPIFPARFHDVIYHLMCADDFIVQQSDKARSYREENLQRASDYMSNMRYWDAQLIQQ